MYMKKDWFMTWNRPEYEEYATETPKGYHLVIIRKEKDRYLCVGAELIMKEKGLPEFYVRKEGYKSTKEEATEQISRWQISF